MKIDIKIETSVIIVAYYNTTPVGYIIGYDKFQDNKSFYCWLTGVDINYRRLGILTQLMQYLMDWAGQNGYTILKIKTRNNRRDMLNFLIKNHFYFTDIEQNENIKDNKINLQKDIIIKNIQPVENTHAEICNDLKELTQTLNAVKEALLQLVDCAKADSEISFIARKDIKKIFNCTDTTVAKLFNRADFPAIMVGEHKVEKTALKKWFQERRV